MSETEKFRTWLKMEAGMREQIEEEVKKSMDPKNLKIECRDEKGKWVEYLS